MMDDAGVPPAGEPRPVAELDDHLIRALRPLHRTRWLILAGFSLLVAAALIGLAVLYSGDHSALRSEQRLAAWQAAALARQDQAIRASCQFWSGLYSIPLVPTPPATKPSPVLVVLIAGARDAWAGEHCGPLAPPPPPLLHWARVYGVSLGR